MAKNDDFNSVNPVNQPSEKICKGKCEKLKPLSAYNNNRTKKDGKQEICRECQSNFMKDYNAQRAYRAKMEKSEQLTAGDVQLDPKPAPLSENGKKVMTYLHGKHVIVDHRDHVKVNLPDKKVAPRPKKADSTLKKVELPMSTGVVFTAEEKRILLASLDKYIGTIDSIMAKLK